MTLPDWAALLLPTASSALVGCLCLLGEAAFPDCPGSGRAGHGTGRVPDEHACSLCSFRWHDSRYADELLPGVASPAPRHRAVRA